MAKAPSFWLDFVFESAVTVRAIKRLNVARRAALASAALRASIATARRRILLRSSMSKNQGLYVSALGFPSTSAPSSPPAASLFTRTWTCGEENTGLSTGYESSATHPPRSSRCAYAVSRRSYSAAVASSILGSSANPPGVLRFTPPDSAPSLSVPPSSTPRSESSPPSTSSVHRRVPETSPELTRPLVDAASCDATLRHVAMDPSGPAPPGTVTLRLTRAVPSPSPPRDSSDSLSARRLRSATNDAIASAAHVPDRIGLSSSRENGQEVEAEAEAESAPNFSSPSARYPVSNPTVFRAMPSPTIRPFRPFTSSGSVLSPASLIASPTSSAASVFWDSSHATPACAANTGLPHPAHRRLYASPIGMDATPQGPRGTSDGRKSLRRGNLQRPRGRRTASRHRHARSSVRK